MAIKAIKSPSFLTNLGERNIALIVLLLVVAASLGWYYLLYQKTNESISILRSEIESLESKIADGERAKRGIEQLRAMVDQANRDRQEFLQELPKEHEVAELLDRLRLSAQESNVKITEINAVGTRFDGAPNVKPLGFSISTEGIYKDTLSFLQQLESYKRFTKIRQVDFGIEGGVSEDPKLTTNYDFTVYTYTGSDPGEGSR